MTIGKLHGIALHRERNPLVAFEKLAAGVLHCVMHLHV